MSRKSLVACLFIVAPILAAGCLSEPSSAPESEPGGEAAEDRGPIGKADLFGQCMEIDIKYCGGKSSGNCWCDDWCETFGDCCADYEPECVADSCDPTLFCGQAISCVDGQYYPTTCGPANCDAPMGPCGEPEPEPKSCGGFAGFQCDEGQFCNYGDADGCGYADQLGTCEVLPEACAEIYAPVCGCNGEDYANACEAHAAGASVKQTGSCACPPGYEMQFCWGSNQCVPIGAQC